MAYDLRKVAVIGAGVMGAGIAAQCANAGLEVLLFDRVDEKNSDASSIAKSAIEKLKKTNPAALMRASFANRITPCNTRDDLALLAECDWVIEAIIEKLEAKHALYAELAKVVGKHTLISSNTSTIPLAELVQGLPKNLQPRFAITHFFNPPRYMRLLELVGGPATAPETLQAFTQVCDVHLGKQVVVANDTPGFIANRIGTYWLHAATTLAIAQNIAIEDADAVLGKPAGVPGTGVFGLLDLVGLDLMPHVLGSMQKALPPEDAFQALGPMPNLLPEMIAAGYTGRKGKGGFYMLDAEKKKLARNLLIGEYKPAQKPKLAAVAASKSKGLRALLEHPSAQARYADAVLSRTFAYALSLLGEAANSLADLDAGMELGYAWKYGPAKQVDKLGTSWFVAHLQKLGLPIPEILRVANGQPLLKRGDKGVALQLTLQGTYIPVPRPAGVIELADFTRRPPLHKNLSAALYDMGDGVALFSMHSKMNTFDPFALSLLKRAPKLAQARGFKALVIANPGDNFSFGANLLMLQVLMWLRLYFIVGWVVRYGQSVMQTLKYAPIPVVAAPQGMALGGGAELVLHSQAVVASSESYIGLVEAGPGIIPGWGGCKELLGRAFSAPKRKGGPMPPIAQTFETIATAKVGKSAFECMDLGFLRPTDSVVMNPRRVLAMAKAKALELAAREHQAEAPHSYPLPGPTAFTALNLALHDFALKGLATPHDKVVGSGLAKVLSGGATDITATPLTEEAILKLEEREFVKLCKTRGTHARVAHLLKTGKPLRN
jgi:3-hydroxyacyl-CoA dehydrogenase